MPGYLGYLIAPKVAQAMSEANDSSRDVIFPYLVGREFTQGDGTPSRFIIDMSVPPGYPDPARLVSDDCIRAD
jgi:hypothetical protein